MVSKNIVAILIILCITIAVVGAYFLFNYRDTVLDDKNTNIKNQQEIKVENKQIIDTTKPFNIDVTYPYIEKENGFNESVANIINEEIKNFQENSLSNDSAVKETDPEGYSQYSRQYDLKISYEKGQVDENIVSIIFSIYNFTGGAHGNGYFAPVNYNLKDNKEIFLADLFIGQSDYLKKISDYSINDLKKQATQRLGSTEGLWIEDGAGPKEDNFSVFLVNKDSITFYFSPYQVAPYVASSFEVVMPR